jgi:Tfp pilus assembly protein PilN
MELNLRPATVVKRHRLAEQRPYLITAGLCLLLALAGGWLYFMRAAEVQAQVLETLTPKVNGLKSFENRMNAVKADIKKQEAVAAPLLQALQDREYWAKVLADLNSRLPADYIWVTNFTPQAPKVDESARPAGPRKQEAQAPQLSVVLSGLYLANPRGASVVDDLIQKLEESPFYEVKKDELKRSVPNEEVWAFEWSVPLTFKNSISIQ